MKHYIFLSFLLFILCFKPVRAQQFSELEVLKGRSIEVYFSSGYRERAAGNCAACRKSINLLSAVAGFQTNRNLTGII
jgi:hypothetical protein